MHRQGGGRGWSSGHDVQMKRGPHGLDTAAFLRIGTKGVGHVPLESALGTEVQEAFTRQGGSNEDNRNSDDERWGSGTIAVRIVEASALEQTG